MTHATAREVPPSGMLLGDGIENYRILECVGEGGFGSVYAADQLHPIRRRVAVKVLKPGMDSQRVIARFEAERQALAMMDHPNIATVLDAGQTRLGRPYFVMEYVRGMPITRYCDEERMTIRARIDLFREVCRAVQHAHQKGIIHRDLKPSNVLVTVDSGRAIPKVIDFGIAKATSAQGIDDSLYTQSQQMLGTPAYMSPEQAGGSALDVDTRSDIYSLGAMLYELLVGTTPLSNERLCTASFADLQRLIAEDPVARPSSRLDQMPDRGAEAARARSTEARRLRQAIAGDLDWIVLRCLDKSRSHRYPTANALNEDLERHLELLPVTARPPSRVHMASRFVRRHRPQVAAAAVIAVVFVAGFAGTIMGWAKATNESAKLRFTLDFFTQALAGAADEQSPSAIWKDDPSLTLGEALVGAEALVGGTFEGEPLLEATIRQLIGLAQLRAGRFEEARAQLGLAHEIRRERLGASSPRTLELLVPLSEAISKAGDFDRAVATATDAYERHAEVYGAEAARSRAVALWIARWFSSAYRFSEADGYFERAIRHRGGVPDVEDAITLAALIERVTAFVSEGQLARAESTLRHAQARVYGLPESEAALRANFDRKLGWVLSLRGKYAEAIEHLSSGLEGSSALPSDRVQARLLAWALGRSGEGERSVEMFERLLEMERRAPGSPFLEIFARLYFADVLLVLGRAEEAAAQARAAIEQYDGGGFPNDPDRLWGWALLAMASVHAGDSTSASWSLRQARAIEAEFPEHVLHRPFVRFAEARMRAEAGSRAEAAEAADSAMEFGMRVLGREHPLVVQIERFRAGLATGGDAGPR